MPDSAPHSSHYRSAIEPIEFIEANHLDFLEGSIVKYVSRWRRKDGIKDLEKASWYLQRLLENARKEQQPPEITIDRNAFLKP